ncbi:MAG: hypothetical protein ACOC3D_07795 [Pseudomonadota bacterium]
MQRTHEAIGPSSGTIPAGGGPRGDVAHLARLVNDLHVPDRAALGRALDDAHTAVIPFDPDPFEVGGAVERVLKCARSAADFCARAEPIAAAVAPLVDWIGPQANRLAQLVEGRTFVDRPGR